VLGVLVEKQATVPDTYPLSLNALVAGCNQKTARSPVIEATEAEVLTAIDGLKGLSLVFEGSSSRVVKFEHNTARVLRLPGQAVALLAVLMLRGPQTAAELRLNCERLHRFADISSVEGFLDELAAKEPPMVVKLARAPGAAAVRRGGPAGSACGGRGGRQCGRVVGAARRADTTGHRNRNPESPGAAHRARPGRGVNQRCALCCRPR